MFNTAACIEQNPFSVYVFQWQHLKQSVVLTEGDKLLIDVRDYESCLALLKQ